jgi:hypothetical protein
MVKQALLFPYFALYSKHSLDRGLGNGSRIWRKTHHKYSTSTQDNLGIPWKRMMTNHPSKATPRMTLLKQELTENLHLTDTPNTFELDFTFVLDGTDHPLNQYGDSGSVKTFRSSCQPKTLSDNTSVEEEEERSSTAKHKAATAKGLKKIFHTPDDMSVNTLNSDNITQETSTLTDSETHPERAFAKMCLQNPDFWLVSYKATHKTPVKPQHRPNKRFLKMPLKVKAMRQKSNVASQRRNRTHVGTVSNEA